MLLYTGGSGFFKQIAGLNMIIATVAKLAPFSVNWAQNTLTYLFQQPSGVCYKATRLLVLQTLLSESPVVAPGEGGDGADARWFSGRGE